MKEAFGAAKRLTPSTFKATLELGKGSTQYYFRSVRATLPDLLTTCEDGDDSEFAVHLLNHVAAWIRSGVPPAIIDLSVSNSYRFDAVFVLPSSYHGHLEGIMDDKHATLAYCVPIHRCEFTGCETSVEYRHWQSRVAVERWKRQPYPYVSMMFENPKADYGSPMVRTSLDSCISNIESLNGVTNGHAELTNYVGETLSIVPQRRGTFQIVCSNRKIDCKATDIASFVTSFATTGVAPK
jgi:hypothetical protein